MRGRVGVRGRGLIAMGLLSQALHLAVNAHQLHGGRRCAVAGVKFETRAMPR